MAVRVAEHGYASVTVGDICSGAGVSRETFYTHFEHKAAVYESICATFAERVRDARVIAAVDGAATLDVIRTALSRYCGIVAADVATARCVLVERADGRASLATGPADFPVSCPQLQNVLGSTDAETCTAFLMLVRGTVAEHVDTGRTDELADAVPRLMSLLRRLLDSE